MNIPKYKDYEKDFLNAMVTRFCFSGKREVAFVERLLEVHINLDDQELAKDLEPNLIKGTKAENAVTIFRDHWIAICHKLAEEGCDFNGTTKYRWRIAKRWLREDIFPQWAREQGLVENLVITADEFWRQILEKAVPTNKMGPVLAGVGVLDIGSGYEECVRLGSYIRFEVNLEKAGYLLLLEKGTTGRFWCLCPSGYAPQQYLPAGVAVLPQPNSPKKSFKVTGDIGLEQIVAVISKDKPILDWFPEGINAPLQLQENHLKQLIEYLDRSRDCQVLYTEYTVTA
ncbi:DUF4384 domain-containing protein [Coleofasciculus sp. FACHB-SPT36]|uniref:DUF4384 domain-containing protein n=1 Tax=Cyanophyceae TaxID=3028117 RepID=UPI00168A7A93|nr:DUF4384 domain-containing protein [Coleofasciculus sp. FACHB-SPT36]MBD2540178.1 DUF4384 domain-containing protein [Coleofasciculus sp. FACHB-SPT36]